MTVKRNYKDGNQYEDIIHLPHPVSRSHPQLSLSERAAQFSPFAALTGHSDAVRETARLTDQWADLDEDNKEGLDRKFRMVQEQLPKKAAVTITYFRPDEKKAGGSYQVVSGVIKKVDAYERKLIMEDGSSISIEHIVQIECDRFDDAAD